jgi:hypothetical protein
MIIIIIVIITMGHEYKRGIVEGISRRRERERKVYWGVKRME